MDSTGNPSKLYSLLVENSLGLMCIHDLDGVLLSINPAAAESLGYRQEDGPGQNLRDFLQPNVRHLFEAYLRRIRRNGKDRGLMRLLARDGTERVWMYRNMLYEEPGSLPCVLGHALDVTDRVKIERALKDARGELRKANESLAERVRERTAELQDANERLRAEIEQRQRVEEELLHARKLESLAVLAGGIAHDFNNFLTVIQANLELARMQLDRDGPILQTLEQTAAACQRAGFLASQLLTFAKGGAPVRRVVSVAQLLEDSVNLIRAGSAVSVDLGIEEGLWSAEIDPGQITQVFHNVLLNAKESMPDGGIIEVRASNLVVDDTGSGLPGRCVSISIRDYGSGIPRDALPRIFDPYFTTKASGSGLGLATAYAIVTKHGGSISVDSQLGEGAVFSIRLPACDAAPPPELPVPAEVWSGSGRLLVMDDDRVIRQLLQRILSNLGYDVECAGDGAEAITLFEAARNSGRPFDAAVLDVTVPAGMGGIETAAKLKELGGALKLIVSSGYSDAPVMSDFRSYGFDDVIPKPWTAAQVSEVLRRVLIAHPDRKLHS